MRSPHILRAMRARSILVGLLAGIGAFFLCGVVLANLGDPLAHAGVEGKAAAAGLLAIALAAGIFAGRAAR